MVGANERQVAGDHYKDGLCPNCGHALQHWDIAWAFRFNCFQYIITKWIMRKKGPEGRHLLSDLEKIVHAAQKYIEVVQMEEDKALGGPELRRIHAEQYGEDAGPGYVKQD